MINVPMFVRWPGVVPEGVVIERTTQSIDLMPTLLELARVPVPEQAQGRSLVPLMAAPDDPAAYGGDRAPVFSETAGDDEEDGTPRAYTVIHDGWKLIWNTVVHDHRPELQLFDHETDPLNLDDVGEEHPEKVAELQRLLERWRAAAEAARVTDEGLAEELTPAEIEELKALGYLD
jgi:arylsulfatase A-like enzyme